jgi:uncharacterized iron-regulated protein
VRRAAIVAAALLLACGTPPPAPRGEDWLSPLGQDHPLAGRIYDIAQGREIDEAELLAGLAGARFVLLGESHENADHHRLQARILRELSARGAEAALAFEMLRADQQSAIDQLQASEAPTAEALRQATRWDEGGWPDFALYAPVFEAALAADLPLIAADLAADERKQLASPEPVPAELRARLGLDEPLPDDLQRDLERDLLASHCGMLPASVLPRLVQVQRGRDAALAQALLSAPGGDGAGEEETRGKTTLLLAGAEHVRHDRGAPRALARLAPGADVRSVAFLEVNPEHRDGQPVFDYVWYTPRASDEDYCERMKR